MTAELSSNADASICVVVPTFNRIALAEPVFRALSSESNRDSALTIVVVDQGSTDGVDQLAVEYGFVLVRSNELTAGGLRNVGVAASTSRWLSFIDSDVLISEGYFSRLRAILELNDSSIVGCNYGLPNNPSWTEKHWHALTYEEGTGPRRWLNAGNMAMARELFESLGGFDSELSSGEDTELCGRARERGREVLQFEEISAAHLGNPKTLLSFFKKQVWHGQGAALFDRNSIAAFAHAVSMSATALFLLRASRLSLAAAAGLFVLANLVPFIALSVLTKRLTATLSVPHSMALLHTYFIARFTALIFRSGKQR